MAPGVLARALPGVPHPMLDLGEGLLDRVEVRRIRGQEPQVRTGDGLAHGLALVAGEIVENDDVTGLQGRDPMLLDPGVEGAAVDRPVEDAGRAQPVVAQPRQEGQGAPAPMRCKPLQTPACRRPAPQRGHVGLDPGLVHEHQSARFQPAPERLPSSPLAGHRGPGLLKGEQRFFQSASPRAGETARSCPGTP